MIFWLISILIVVGTCTRPCVAARGEAALRAKARGLPRATRQSCGLASAAKPRHVRV